jgi:hypothetical protein
VTEILTPAAAVPADPALPAADGALSAADAGRVKQTLEGSVSAATRKAYASDWRSFASWCRAKGYTSCCHRFDGPVQDVSIRPPVQRFVPILSGR